MGGRPFRPGKRVQGRPALLRPKNAVFPRRANRPCRLRNRRTHFFEILRFEFPPKIPTLVPSGGLFVKAGTWGLAETIGSRNIALPTPFCKGAEHADDSCLFGKPSSNSDWSDFLCVSHIGACLLSQTKAGSTGTGFVFCQKFNQPFQPGSSTP